MSTSILKCVIIDDSKTQRTAVSKLIKDHKNLILIDDYENGIKAQKGLTDKHVDIVFLDIEMPVINGFQFIESLEERPQIILITSKPQYAMQAFDYDVTDYLMKPITSERFNKSIQKALLRSRGATDEEEEHIFVNSKLKKVKIFLKDIRWIEGLGDYLKIITDSETYLVLSTMKNFMNQLPAEDFLRIHKSYIVNLNRVERYNSQHVELCGNQIPLSRHKKLELEEALLNASVH
ncbi:LytR/AlgR family response regulator transcription factor [Pseudozobellia thermophila]|uniref:Two component transcriptional regulator, LytTR family n=1 Tax=Pseudozobellia thermophila TaxID=192903 RepID=A0A1M6FQC5_9FLAO|nr:LytTR family DNA-binding domain-containing protein [Pseudozobellia thermophila]SHI99876.1 two component transcriptional regulator, LytTR family [Pseudozobellia thermophila]